MDGTSTTHEQDTIARLQAENEELRKRYAGIESAQQTSLPEKMEPVPVLDITESKSVPDKLHTASIIDMPPPPPTPTQKGKSGMALLFEDDPADNMPYLSAFLRTVGGIGAEGEDTSSSSHGKKKTKLGVLLGVYLPSIQHILGVQMFLRLLWIVGSAGVTESVLMLFLCCLCTFLTSISISAIATNGKIESGGTYFMISRNLGPEFGGAIGILYYLANTVATAMYLVGGVEMLLVYMAPGLPQFGPVHDEHAMFNNFRLYGTAFLLVIFVVCAGGVRIVQLFGPVSLTAVILSILAVFVGAFTANPDSGPMICLLGDRLIKPEAYFRNGTPECNKTMFSGLWQHYCSDNGTCDPHFINSEARYIAGIPGFASGVIHENAGSMYLHKGESTSGYKGDPTVEVVQDMSTNWFILLAIFFPSVTGIMTGANMSGDLKDPQRSIPLGTIAAQLTTSLIYLGLVICYGGAVEGALLRDKYGASVHGSMIVAQLAWPNQWVLLVGSFLACLGAGLQCLCSAPRLLQAIAKDDLIPFLGFFRAITKRGEPFRALLVSTLIAECAVLIGSIDYIAPVVDFFFLMSYCFANISCTLQTLLRAPNWRPRFRYYHWTLSLLGALLCLFIMFATYWYYAIVVTVLCVVLYKYIEFKGAKKEWGDGMRGLALSTAQYSLLKTEGKVSHPKNWRPQILVLMKPEETDHKDIGQPLLNLAAQLKAGQGLTVAASLIKGDISNHDDREKQTLMRVKIRHMMKSAKLKGFVEAVLIDDVSSNLGSVIQCIGMGALRPNALMVAWPCNWRVSSAFYDALRFAVSAEMCLLLPKGLDNFPEIGDQLTGTIDVWWIMHDGGLLILLPFLLRQHRVWRGCKMRVFAVAQMEDNVAKLKENLTKWVYQLRIDCTVEVVTLPDSAVYAYTNERTLMIAERIRLASSMHLNRKMLQHEPQILADAARYGASIDDYFRQKSSNGNILKNFFVPGEMEGRDEDEDYDEDSSYGDSSTDRERIKKKKQSDASLQRRASAKEPRVKFSIANNSSTDCGVIPNTSSTRLNAHFQSHKNPAFEPDDESSTQAEESNASGAEQAHPPTDTTDNDSSSHTDNETESRPAATELKPPNPTVTFDEASKPPPPVVVTSASSSHVPTIKSGRFSITSHTGREQASSRNTSSRPSLTPEEEQRKKTARKMHTALTLNQVIKEQSWNSRLVVLNLPRPPSAKEYFPNYMQYLEALTKDLQRILLVRGSGREVITIYS